jgi:hypothetical protein
MPRRRFVPRRLLMLFDGLRLGNGDRSIGFTAHRCARPALHSLPKLFGDVIIDRAGVGLLFGNAELWQHVDDGMRGDLKLPCQLIDSDFAHK